MDVVVGQVVLLLGEFDEFADFFLNLGGIDAGFVFLVWLGRGLQLRVLRQRRKFPWEP